MVRILTKFNIEDMEEVEIIIIKKALREMSFHQFRLAAEYSKTELYISRVNPLIKELIIIQNLLTELENASGTTNDQFKLSEAGQKLVDSK